ncbi:MAG: hypothetical protein ACI8UQ_002182 [Bacteroidia bacterium]|jgi:hypothetical protein
MKNILIILSLTLLFFGCKSDKDDIPEHDNHSIKVSVTFSNTVNLSSFDLSVHHDSLEQITAHGTASTPYNYLIYFADITDHPYTVNCKLEPQYYDSVNTNADIELRLLIDDQEVARNEMLDMKHGDTLELSYSGE